VGFLRTYLALCVVASHASATCADRMLNGMEAVQLFYVISGFYMQLILTGRYASVGQFYESRALRIFVPYFFVLLFVVAGSLLSGLLSGQWLALQAYTTPNAWGENYPLAIALAAATNLTVFGQDLLFFVSGTKTIPPLSPFLVIPPSWTIGLELTFYALVPFLVRWSSLHLFLLMAASLLARFVGCSWLGLAHDPWLYRFFPFEIALFVAGMLTCRAYHNFMRHGFPTVPYGVVAGGVLALLTAWTWFLPEWPRRCADLLPIYLLYAMMIPVFVLVFAATSRNRVDRALGELSFPIYLNHFFVLQFFKSYGFGGLIPAAWQGEFIMVVSLLLAIVMTVLFLAPFERWRHRLVHVPS
jgi:peptidoglycan/LPS O-acetylase OafA/YrhL